MYVFGIKNIYDKIVNIIELPQVNCIFHEKLVGLYPLLKNSDISDLWDVLLLCSQVLDKTYIIDSLQLKSKTKGNQRP